MRLTLVAAPLLLLASSVNAETALGTSSNAASTATVADGAADDILVNGSATLTPASGAALTIDSNNSVDNEGSISFSAVDGAAGILGLAGYAGSITNAGSITIDDDYTASDSANDDDVLEAPFAAGSGRYGVRTLGDFTGSITNSGSITVDGDQSYGVSVDGALNGSLINSGSIALTGDDGAALRTTGTVSGDVAISGSVSSLGQGSSAVVLGGDVGGRLSVYSAISSTGYSLTTRPTTESALNKIQATAADLQQGGAALSIAGDVAGGVFIGAPPDDTDDDSTEDLDGDGVADGEEGDGSVTSYGSAPAIRIGGTEPLTIGAFGAGDNAYGLIVRGSVGGYGVYDGFSATGIDIGSGATIEGGVRVVGTVEAAAYEADATAIHLGSGATVPSLRIEGVVAASVENAGAHTATALSVDAGAQMDSLVNYATLSAAVTGNAASAVAVRDLSGSISFVENTGAISATISPETAGDETTGRAVALDLSANTRGVRLRQELNGDTEPSIEGDILLGSGSNTVELLAGSITGALDMGSGASALMVVDGGASYLGAFSYSGSGLSLQILDGSFETTNPQVLRGVDVVIGADGALTLAVDPDSGAASTLEMSGAVSIAAGGQLGVRLLSAPDGMSVYRLIQAGSLTVEDLSSLSVTAPYLFSATPLVDLTAGTVDVTLRTRSAAEMGLNASESAALSAVYAALSQDAGVEAAILDAADRETFIGRYNQLLPDHSGDVFQVVSQISRAGGRAALEDRLPSGGYWDSGVAVWAQEFLIGIDQAKGDGEAYRAGIVGMAAGVEATAPGSALGLSFTAATSNVDQWTRPGESNLSLSLLEWGVYWRADANGWLLDARAAAGYLTAKNRRTLAATVDDESISRTALGQWNGYEFSGRLALAYEARLGPFHVRPSIHGDVLTLRESDYAESGGGDGYDLVVSERDSHSASVTASLAFGSQFGEQTVWRPEFEIGWTETFSADAGATTARFAYGGDSFTLTPNSIEGGAVIARAGLNAGNGFVRANLQATGEFAEDRTIATARAAFKIPF